MKRCFALKQPQWRLLDNEDMDIDSISNFKSGLDFAQVSKIS